MATKRPKRRNTKPKQLKRGQAIRVPGAGTVTITTDGAVLFRGAPLQPNPTRRRKPAKRKPTTRKRAVSKKRPTKRATRRARR